MPSALPFDRQPKPHGVTGREKEEWPPLPAKIAQYRIDNVIEWLYEHRNIRRPPGIAGPLLALICWLHEHEYPLPSRERLAIWITDETGPDAYFTSKDGQKKHKKAGSIDAALSTALGEDEVRETIRVVPGRIENRSSARRFRYILPSKQLLAAYNARRGSQRDVA